MNELPKGVAIRVESVSKDFKLPKEKVTSIKSFITQSLKKRTKGYTVQHALEDITFDIREGEFFGIVGRNGSGKSTLLKILAEIYQPTSGSVQHRGRLVPFIELGVGFNPELTGRENVYLNGAMLGFSNAEIDEMYDDIVQFAELEMFMDQKLKNYSSGMQVRLAFSVATRAKADVLIVDEVLAVGDANFQRKCFNYFKSLKKNKKTVVFVSHDMNAVREYCDRAILIEKSKVIRSGRVAKVASAYTKMFIQDSSEANTENRIERKRWGDGSVKLSNVSVTPNTASENDGLLTLTMTAETMKPTNKTIFGFTIKNGVGTEMLGSNSKLVHFPAREYAVGEKLEVTWHIPNILNDGDYSVDVTAIDGDSFVEYDWWEDSTAFSIVRNEHTAYVVEPAVKLTIDPLR